ncbi:uncharacterized protein LOC128549797 [Mercenaria mercenaria]|uniref:uncharacterized protein LOC128549797 n=1 Tax=Mercenaria mercenaria TaxID=6596 RepID=UPI00234F4B34|nr:uncharacterized protein LOC128549797 [Mercenaria mercenaria]
MATGGSCAQYKPENEYFCRYFRLVNETGAKPLRKLLENEAAIRKMTVSAFLANKKHTFVALLQRNKIRQFQFDLIFPTQGNFDMNSLDVSLLCFIIRNVCNLSKIGRKAAEDLRQARNELCHDSNPEMLIATYQINFSKVCNILKALLKECGDATFEAKTEQEMNAIDKDPISPAQTLELVKTYLDGQKAVKSVKEKINDLDKKIGETTNDLTTEMKSLYATVEKQPKETTDAVEKLLKAHIEREESTARIHPTIEPLRKQTEVILNEVSNFVHTEQFHEAENMLLSTGNVIIIGGAGEGKTYTAFEIMRRHGNGNNCLQISSPNDVYLIDPRIFEFVFIDDIFGNNELDESKLKSWIPVLEKLQQLVNAKELKLIIATREIVFKECIQSLNKFTMFARKTVLSSGKLSSAEKLEILSKALNMRKRLCSEEIMQKCVSAFNSDLGFPYMCILFSSDDQFFLDRELFFKRNLVMNSGIVSQLTPCKQMTLLFLWIKGKRFPVVFNRSEENDEILMKLSDIVKYKKDIDTIYDEIHRNLKVMDGVFVNVRSDGYQFAHNSIYQSTGFYVAQKGLYDKVIQYSNLTFFMEHITISEDVYRADCVFVRKPLYQNLVDRVIAEVVDNNHVREMAVHPCLSRDILKLLIETLKKRKQLKEFLLSRCCDRNDQSYQSFIAYYLETCSNKKEKVETSCWFLAQVLGYLKCKRHFTQVQKETDCRSYEVQLHACHGACRGGNLDAFKLVPSVKFNKSFLVEAAESGNTDMYIHVKGLLNPATVKQGEALTKAVENGDIKMYNAIRRAGCPVTTKCLQIAAMAKNSDLVRLITHDLSTSRPFRVDANVSYTLSTLFDMDVFETFIQNGICPSKEHLWLSRKGNYKLVESILWDMKYADKRQTFDPKLKIWSEIVNDTLWRQELVAMGILETSTFLENNIEMGNVERVKEIIQHLTHKNDWDPVSPFAVNLLNSTLPSNIPTFHFLLSCDVIPCVTTLYKAVLTGELDVVKMTVTKLKTAGKFGPNNTSIKRAFLQSAFYLNIYEFLISEGLQPSAYHFRFVIECQRENVDTLNVVQQMFSLVRNLSGLNKQVMQSALLVAIDKEEVFQCFTEHGVLLPYETLPTISISGTFKEMERAIKHLKRQNVWPPDENNMTRSLSNTFYKPDIFELLMMENAIERNEMPISVYSILFVCRKKEFSLIDNYISTIQENDAWNPEDIVLKCALLESSEDKNSCEIFKRNGVRTDDILDDAYGFGSAELQSYIIASLIQKGETIINYKTLNKYIVSSLSRYQELCSEQLLDRAVDVCETVVVSEITKHLAHSNPSFPQFEAASAILSKSSGRHDLYSMFLEAGFCPTLDCLSNVVKYGSLENFQDTIKILNDMDRLPTSINTARKILQESLRRNDVRFYTILSAYGLKPQYEDICFAIENGYLTICKYLIGDLENVSETGSENVVLRVLETDVKLYKRLCERNIQLTSAHLRLILDSYLYNELPFDRLETVINDFFSNNSWSFEDPNLKILYDRSKIDDALWKVLFEHTEFAMKNRIITALFLTNCKDLKDFFNNSQFEINRLLPDILRQLCILRKRIHPDCRKLIFERVLADDCSSSLKILASVMNSVDGNTFEIVYSLSDSDKQELDKNIIQTALEEAMFLKKPAIYLCLLSECHIEPTTYCLLYSLYQKNDLCFNRTLKMLPQSRKTCKDPYYKATLALCCQRVDLTTFRSLLKFDKFCDTEMLFEALMYCNRIAADQVKEILMTNSQWDVTFKDYWISSALFEKQDDPTIMSFLESDYEVPDDCLLDTETEYLQPISANVSSVPEGRNRYSGIGDSEPVYEEILDTFFDNSDVGLYDLN